jgi:hypothetical protein
MANARRLHHSLDQLLAAYLTFDATARPSKMSVMDLLTWSKGRVDAEPKNRSGYDAQTREAREALRPLALTAEGQLEVARDLVQEVLDAVEDSRDAAVSVGQGALQVAADALLQYGNLAAQGCDW